MNEDNQYFIFTPYSASNLREAIEVTLFLITIFLVPPILMYWALG